MGPPGKLNTLYTMLKRAKESVNALGFEYTPVTFDKGLLSRALEGQWSCQEELSGVVLCDGGMHCLLFQALDVCILTQG